MDKLPITYEFVTPTTSIKLVSQYFQLRQEQFTDYWNLQSFAGGADNYDVLGNILLLKQSNKCIGGIRLVTSAKDSDTLLPLETEDFRVAKLFPELKIESSDYYGEMGRSALLPDFRKNGEYSKEMYRLLSVKSKEMGHKYSFAVAPVVVARKVRIAFTSFGLHTEIRSDITVPPLPCYEGIEMRLLIMDVAGWNIPDNIADTSNVKELHILEN